MPFWLEMILWILGGTWLVWFFIVKYIISLTSTIKHSDRYGWGNLFLLNKLLAADYWVYNKDSDTGYLIATNEDYHSISSRFTAMNIIFYLPSTRRELRGMIFDPIR